jgi:hypothetical protein
MFCKMVMARWRALVRNAQALIRHRTCGGTPTGTGQRHSANAVGPVITMQWRRERVKLRRGIRDFSNGEQASSLV